MFKKKIKSPNICIGYDVEGGLIKRYPQYGKNLISLEMKILQKIISIHDKYDIPLTLFVLGKNLENREFVIFLCKTLNNYGSDFINIESHSYSHKLFKHHAIKGAPHPDDIIKKDIMKSKQLLIEKLNIAPIGIRTPTGFYKGLQGSRNVLQILSDLEFGYISSDLRGVNDELPSKWIDDDNQYRQPYWYFNDLFPKLLEIPVQGNFDIILKGLSKLTSSIKLSPNEELQYYVNHIQYAIENKLLYSMLFHPWVIGITDEDNMIVQKLLHFIQENSIISTTYIDVYNRLRGNL